MQTTKQITNLLCLIGLLASGATLAQDTRFYVGFSAGQARPSFDSTPAVAGGLPINYDSSAGAWKGFGGFQFTKYIGVEGTYYSFGSYNANVNTGSGFLYTSIQATGWGAALTGTLPLGKDFSLTGRAGQTYVRETRGNCGVCAVQVTSSSSNIWSPTYGVGLKYDMTPNWSARAEYEHFTKIGSSNDSTFGGTVNLYTAGVAYRF